MGAPKRGASRRLLGVITGNLQLLKMSPFNRGGRRRVGGTGQVGDPGVTAQLLLAPTLWERGGTFFSCRFLSPLPLSFSEARIWLKNFFMVIYGREPRWGSSQQRSGAAARPYLGFLHGTGGLGARSPPHFISLLKASLPRGPRYPTLHPLFTAAFRFRGAKVWGWHSSGHGSVCSTHSAAALGARFFSKMLGSHPEELGL